LTTIETPVEQPLSPPCAESEVKPEHAEDSVDAFMARLLARSRNDSDPPQVSQQVSSPVADQSSVGSGNEALETIQGPVDRSHLLAEPKHKQDKQAVRENLQSFRQVAHLSARTALARHSMRQLRNATIVKGVLLIAALIASVVYVAEPLFGRPIQIWKASGCGLAALLSGLEFWRSWCQLRKPIKSALPGTDKDQGQPNGEEGTEEVTEGTPEDLKADLT
jgi:hypothetical protein